MSKTHLKTDIINWYDLEEKITNLVVKIDYEPKFCTVIDEWYLHNLYLIF